MEQSFGGLDRLVELDLSLQSEEFELLARVFGPHNSLRRLRLDSCAPLEFAPHSLDGLRSLEELCIERCVMESIPASLAEAGPSLRRLHLREIKCLEIDQNGLDVLLALRRLEVLDFGVVPDSLDELSEEPESAQHLGLFLEQWQNRYPGSPLPALNF